MPATIPMTTISPTTLWAFDLGKASIGEAVRRLDDNSFPHVESLLIPAELARRGPAAANILVGRKQIGPGATRADKTERMLFFHGVGDWHPGNRSASLTLSWFKSIDR